MIYLFYIINHYHMLTQYQVENDFKYIVLPKLREVHGENKNAFQDEWLIHLNELVRDRLIPAHAVNDWTIKL